MKKILIALVISITFVITSVFLRFIFGGPEDGWICQKDGWVQHGNPNTEMPKEKCGEEKEKSECGQTPGFEWCESKKRCIQKDWEPCQVYEFGLTEIQQKTRSYIEQNIKTISPVDPVLGGTWYVTSVDFTDDDKVLVTCEDGHIQARFTANYSLKNDEIVLENITERP